ncbi:MAG: HAD-IA family hydrolase [Pseudomonadota bacterium]
MEKRCVVFDLDGTLADTSRDLIGSANARFEALGHGALLDPIDDASTAFRGGRAMLRLGFSRVNGTADENEVEREYPLLLEAYAERIDLETVLYPGAEAAVEALLGAGYATAICTNKPEGLAETLMRRLGVRDLFGSLIGADTLVPKPDPRPYRAAVERAGGAVEHSCLIGDTLTDRDTARAAGVPVVLVTFGPEGRAVADLEPDGLLGSYDRLGGEIARLIG